MIKYELKVLASYNKWIQICIMARARLLLYPKYQEELSYTKRLFFSKYFIKASTIINKISSKMYILSSYLIKFIKNISK